MKFERWQERERAHRETLAENEQTQFKRTHKEWKKRQQVPRTARCLGCGNIITACTCGDHTKPHYMTQITNFQRR